MSAEEATPVAPSMDSGISSETHNQIKDENTTLREQVAALKARTELHDARQRETLVGMKEDVSGFINDIAGAEEFASFKHELAPMQRWCGEMDKGEANLETNLALGRLVSCASAKFKRSREEASQLTEKSTVLASTMKELEEVKGDRDTKVHRITELEGLLNERTEGMTKLQDELAKAGLLKDKIDFSQKSARENTDAGSSSKAPMPNVQDALMGFITSGPMNGSGRIGQSSTGHHWLGATSGQDQFSAALAAQ